MPKETLAIQQLCEMLNSCPPSFFFQLFEKKKKEEEVIKFNSLHSNMLRHYTQVTNNHS